MDYEQWKNFGRPLSLLGFGVLGGMLFWLLDDNWLAIYCVAVLALLFPLFLFSLESQMFHISGLLRLMSPVLSMGLALILSINMADQLYPGTALSQMEFRQAGDFLEIPQEIKGSHAIVLFRSFGLPGTETQTLKGSLEVGKGEKPFFFEMPGGSPPSVTARGGGTMATRTLLGRLTFPQESKHLILKDKKPEKGLYFHLSLHRFRISPLFLLLALLPMVFASIALGILEHRESESAFFPLLGTGALCMFFLSSHLLQPGQIGSPLFVILVSAFAGGVFAIFFSFVLAKTGWSNRK